ncbi:MAG TPA: HAMP domain-containing sensor histidine kinase [Bacteroidales bacterium]|nr:HAMP domain-containing sensor histidine kinase [Bacteroidales bacterium]
MRPSTVKIIIIVTSIALLGLVFTQTFWIREKIILGQKQFDHRADNALMDVVGELRDYADSTARQGKIRHMQRVRYDHILDVVDTSLLEVLVKKYTDYHRLDNRYYYSIAKSSNDSAIFRSAEYPAEGTAVKPYKACLSCLWKEEYFHLALFFPDKNKTVFLESGIWLGLTFMFLSVITFSFAFIIITYLRQKKLSEMKNDFINNMTHEFKTPISTIALAAEVLMKGGPRSIAERIKKYSKIIYDENERMRLQVERVLQMAQMDHQEIRLNPAEIDIHNLLGTIIPNLCLEKSEKEVRVKYNLAATKPLILADEMYVTSVITNITENAIKYSGDNPEITIATADHKEGIMISFIDKGVGMSRDILRYIFDKFYRVHTGNVHNVKGFGLGLYYAKTMIDAHRGSISVTSELNKGSRFDVYLPGTINTRE